MNARAPLAVILSLVLVAGCDRTVRTRFALSAATAPGQSCALQCDAAPDPAACLQACPGAIVEPDRTCATRQPRSHELCYEQRERDTGSTIVATSLLTTVGLAAAGVIFLFASVDHRADH